jgi:hypothetical protein
MYVGFMCIWNWINAVNASHVVTGRDLSQPNFSGRDIFLQKKIVKHTGTHYIAYKNRKTINYTVS